MHEYRTTLDWCFSVLGAAANDRRYRAANARRFWEAGRRSWHPTSTSPSDVGTSGGALGTPVSAWPFLLTQYMNEGVSAPRNQDAFECW
jgi:hypothetical protein